MIVRLGRAAVNGVTGRTSRLQVPDPARLLPPLTARLDNGVQYSPMEPQIHPPRRVHGVDFSGAQNAWKLIWVASCVIDGDALRVEDCRPVAELPGSGRDLGGALTALRDFIAESKDCVFGLDFPFGLPRSLIQDEDWESFIRSFPNSYPSAGEFKRACFEAAGRKELKRLTDCESRTPFSPYNLRLYKQTYFGIRDVLVPLVHSEQVCVLPMQRPESGKAWVLEICPASSLRRRGLYGTKYKEKSPGPRHDILSAYETSTPLCIPKRIRSRIVNDRGGDALDSVIAACAVFAALPNLARVGREKVYALEGYVYV